MTHRASSMGLAPRLPRRVDLASASLLLLVWANLGVLEPHQLQQRALAIADCAKCLPRARTSFQPLLGLPTRTRSEPRVCASSKRLRTTGGMVSKSTCRGRPLARRMPSELMLGWASSLTWSRRTTRLIQSSPLRTQMTLTTPWSSLARSWRAWKASASTTRASSALRSTRRSLQPT